MASYKIPYPGLNESLKHLRLQVIESLPYVAKHTPRMNSPEQIFNYAKKRFKYKNDPPGVEFFQTVPTLLTDNNFFRAGEGDCDDATIFVLSLLLINGFPAGIVLTGRNKYRPSHIYAYTDENGQKKFLDLTNKNYNQIRPYPFFQTIPFKISKNQLDMFLQLADNGNKPTKKRFNRIKSAPTRLKILTDTEKGQAVYIPSKNVFIPAHRFDRMSNKKVSETLLSEGYDPGQINEFLSGKAERKAKKAFKQEKKRTKFETKTAKKKAKTEVIQAKAEKKRGSAEKKRLTGQARVIKSQAKMRKAESGEEPAYKSIMTTAGNVVNRIFSPEETEPEEVEAEEVEQEETEPAEVEQEETEQEEMSEGVFNLSASDLITGALFIGGAFAERKGIFK